MGEDAQIQRRVALIGDIHGQADVLVAALSYLANISELDAILCAGDIPAKKGKGDTRKCCHLLMDSNVLTVRGNHDRWALEEKDNKDSKRVYDAAKAYYYYARKLPATRLFELPFGSAMLCHGLAEDDMAVVYPDSDEETVRRALKERRIYGRHRVLFCGHTHIRMVRQVGSVVLLNAGALHRDCQAGFLIADFELGDVSFFNIDRDTGAVTPAETVTLFSDPGPLP